MTRVGGDLSTQVHPRVSIHFIDDEGVLFDSADGRLYSANTAAAFVWCCLEEGLSPKGSAARLAEQFCMDGARAQALVDDALREWRSLGLMGDGVPTPVADPRRRRIAPRNGPTAMADVRRLAILDSTFAVAADTPELAAEIDRAFRALPVADPSPSELVMRVAGEDGRFELLFDGRCEAVCDRIDKIYPTLKAHLVQHALEHSTDFAALHAGAVTNGKACLLFPGPSGRGKSTTSASLVSRGYRLLGDDTIVLADAEGLPARAVPMGICMKAGAWAALKDRLPEIAELPVHERLDGVNVRYYWPESRLLCSDPAERFHVTAIVLPDFREGAKAELRAVRRPDALRRVMLGFCPLGDDFTGERVERLLQWVAGLDCFELTYGTTEEALDLLDGLSR